MILARGRGRSACGTACPSVPADVHSSCRSGPRTFEGDEIPDVHARLIELEPDWHDDRAAEGEHVTFSSHVLQEVDLISDQVVLIANGMIVAEGTGITSAARRRFR